MSIAVTPISKLKKPLSLILKGETVQLFHHEKGSSYCVVELANGESKTAALCDLDYVGKAPGKGLNKKPKPLTEKQVNDKKDMNSFFDSLADKIPFNCTNCRKPLYALTKFVKRCVCSHILPKEIFKTIAIDPDNIDFLGCDFVGCPCDCHDRWGKNVESRMHKDMARAYERALKRYHEKLKFKIPSHQIGAAEEYLGITKKPVNLLKDLQEVKS